MFSFGRENTGLVAKWWRNVDKQILFLFTFLLLLGLFFSFSSTTSVMSEKMNKQTYFFFIKHLIFVSVALLSIFTISIQEKNKLIRILTYLFIVSIVLLFLTLLLSNLAISFNCVPFKACSLKLAACSLQLSFLFIFYLQLQVESGALCSGASIPDYAHAGWPVTCCQVLSLKTFRTSRL